MVPQEEMQGRKCPGGKECQEDRRKVRGRGTDTLWPGQWNRSTSRVHLFQARVTEETQEGDWAFPMSQNPQRWGLAPEQPFVPGWHRFTGRGLLLVLGTISALIPLTRSWKSTVAPLSRSFSKISKWPSREARCSAVRWNCPQRSCQGLASGPGSEPLSPKVEA
jgi:hypothetical protein